MKVILALLSLAMLGAEGRVLVPTLDGRIVGGNDTTIEEHPYQVGIERYHWQICGGSIISPEWVVSAAHCANEHLISKYVLRVGSSFRNTGGSIYYVSRFIIHPKYNLLTLDYDIVLIRPLSPIQFGINVQPIKLVLAEPGPLPGSIATVIGWGATDEEGIVISPVLQEISIPVISQEDCINAYGETRITDRMFCAGLLGEGGKDACQGDSGGPIIISELLTGLVSWGIGCARPNYPGVETNIAKLRDWIEGITGI